MSSSPVRKSFASFSVHFDNNFRKKDNLSWKLKQFDCDSGVGAGAATVICCANANNL